MAVQSFSFTYTSDTSRTLPSNSRNIRVTVAAAPGGNGGLDIGNNFEPGGTGGAGRIGTFALSTNFVARTLQFRIGGIGGTGTNGSSSAAGIGGAGGTSSVAPGGRGQNERQNNWSGGAGGGGGASGVFDSFSSAWVAVAGGGGGGGGASDNRAGGNGTNGSGWGAGFVSPSGGAGFGTEFTSGDGGGGGGGGGGAPGGARGTQGADDSTSSTGGSGGASTYNSSLASFVSGGSHGGSGYAVLTYDVVTPQINSFFANPNPQTSGSDGIPNYDSQLNWSTTDAQTVSITNIGSVSVSGSTPISLPQSTVGVTSPASRTYTLTACAGTTCVSSTIVVQVYNDNTPNNYTIPNQIGLNPDTFYTVNVGSITGIDMVTNVIGGPGVTVSKNNTGSFSSSITIVNGDIVQLRFRSDPFNVDPLGQPTTPRSLYVDVGTLRRFFSISTRAPDVNETFNLSDQSNRVPYPDIDTINELSDPYIVSQTLSIDDIELQDPNGVEIKTNNQNIQIRKKITGTSDWGPWRDVRSI